MIISVGQSRKSTDWRPKEVDWAWLTEKFREPVRTLETMAQWAEMDRDQKAAIKDVGGFVGGFVDGKRKAGAVESRQLITLDADFATGFNDTVETWELMVGSAAIFHTTHSHTPENPRLRIIVPLSRPVSSFEYEAVARRLASMVDIEIFDDTTYEFNRLMFWPSVCSDGEYLVQTANGDPADPDELLATYTDPRDMREWPLSSRQQKAVRKMADKQGDPLTKPGLIGAFNRAHSIEDAIGLSLPDLYAKSGVGRWTYTKGTTTGGAVEYDDGTFLYSHHDTDPTHGRLCSAYDLVRIHLYGQLDVGTDTEDPSSWPSTKAMKQLCAGDKDVCDQLAVAVRRNPEELFVAGDPLERFQDDLSEQGLATAFVDEHVGNLHYNKAFGWMLWDGTVWLMDAEEEVGMLLMQFADRLYGQARTALYTADSKDQQEAAKALMKASLALRKTSGRVSLLSTAANIVHDPYTDSWDSKAWELNTPGGIIDLQTGALRPHDRASRHTKITKVTPGDQGKQMWSEFIRYVTGGDSDFAAYLQRVLGMATVGAVYSEGLLMSYGPGANGKSTLYGSISTVMGTYAGTINADVLVTSQGKTDQSYIAAMRGLRLVVMGETQEGAHLDNAQLKRLTSRDKISARKLYKDPIEFSPVHTIVMHTNFLPRLGSVDHGTQRRIAIAPFTQRKPPEQVITNYEEVLVRECGPAILQWLIDGAVAFHAAGNTLGTCAVVKEATDQYIGGEDWMGRFLDDCCNVSGKASESGGALYQRYAAWAKAEGEYIRRSRDFANQLKERGFVVRKTKTGNMWDGLEIREIEA